MRFVSKWCSILIRFDNAWYLEFSRCHGYAVAIEENTNLEINNSATRKLAPASNVHYSKTLPEVKFISNKLPQKNGDNLNCRHRGTKGEIMKIERFLFPSKLIVHVVFGIGNVGLCHSLFTFEWFVNFQSKKLFSGRFAIVLHQYSEETFFI